MSRVARLAQWKTRHSVRAYSTTQNSGTARLKGPQPEAQKANGQCQRPRLRLGSWGGFSEPPPLTSPPARGPGSIVSFPSRVWGTALTTQWFFSVVGTRKSLFWTKQWHKNLDWFVTDWFSFRFVIIHTFDGQTDRRTDGQTDRQNSHR